MRDKSRSRMTETSAQKIARMEKVFDQSEMNLLTADIRRLLIWAYESYSTAFSTGDVKESMYWDGYIRALHHVLEGVGQ